MEAAAKRFGINREAVELAERTEVEFEPKVVGLKALKPGSLDAIYEVMSRRFNTGETDSAARHNERQHVTSFQTPAEFS